MYECSSKPPNSVLLVILHRALDFKRYVFALLFCLPTSLIAFLLLFLLAYNGVIVFWIRIPFVVKHPAFPASLSLEVTASQPLEKWSTSKLSSSALNTNSSPAILTTHIPILHKREVPVLPSKNFYSQSSRRTKRHKRGLRSVRSEPQLRLFRKKLRAFFSGNNSSFPFCKLRFFMTWIASLKSFGDRELLVVQSLFKFHPAACLVIVSKSLDSEKGREILGPFINRGYRVIAIAPDFDYIFKGTLGDAWFIGLRKGVINPGEVSLGQNVSNLLRLVLLYRYGGIYIDADILVLKSLSKLRNTIGAQNFDVQTGNWSRLNNAMLIFDKKHPLLYKFIEEFVLTFDGNKWGHNGPYLVSRVVSRVRGRPGFNFTVLPPSAFYPVDWMKIQCLFEGPRDEHHSKWLGKKVKHIQNKAFALHLWNRQSRNLEVQKGSVIDYFMSSCCIFCNSSESNL